MTQLLVGNASRTELTVDGQRLALLQSGPVDASPVLLLPGYTGSKEDFAPILDPLAAAGYRVTALDLPGQFESPGTDDPDAYTARLLGSLIDAVSRRLGEHVRLLGHSFGGLVARAAVIEAPELFDSLVLMSSGPAQIGGRRRQRIEALAPVLAAHGLSGVYAAMSAAEAADPSGPRPSPELAAFLQDRFLRSSPTMLQGMGDALRLEPDRVGELAATGVPVLVLHGEHDDAWPPDVQAEMATRLQAEYTVVPGAAHSPAVEAPGATVHALLNFWQG